MTQAGDIAYRFHAARKARDEAEKEYAAAETAMFALLQSAGPIVSHDVLYLAHKGDDGREIIAAVPFRFAYNIPDLASGASEVPNAPTPQERSESAAPAPAATTSDEDVDYQENQPHA